MSVYKVKNKNVIKLKFLQPVQWEFVGQVVYTLTEIAEEGYWDDTYIPKAAWKTLGGKDFNYYFKRLTEINEVISKLDELDSQNYYFSQLKDIQNKLKHVGSSLDTIYTSVSNGGKRSKLFKKYESPKIKVDK